MDRQAAEVEKLHDAGKHLAQAEKSIGDELAFVSDQRLFQYQILKEEWDTALLAYGEWLLRSF